MIRRRCSRLFLFFPIPITIYHRGHYRTGFPLARLMPWTCKLTTSTGLPLRQCICRCDASLQGIRFQDSSSTDRCRNARVRRAISERTTPFANYKRL